ncbi:unnamed protein product, partial [Prorocentrum cordatum]
TLWPTRIDRAARPSAYTVFSRAAPLLSLPCLPRPGMSEAVETERALPPTSSHQPELAQGEVSGGLSAAAQDSCLANMKVHFGELFTLLQGIAEFDQACRSLESRPREAEYDEVQVAVASDAKLKEISLSAPDYSIEAGVMTPSSLQILSVLRSDLETQITANKEFFGDAQDILCKPIGQILDGKFDKCSKEEGWIQEDIGQFILRVFEDILKDSGSYRLMMNDFKTKIERLTAKCKKCSNKLSQDDLVPERLIHEEERTKCITDLYDLHHHRAIDAERPSNIPELLKNSQRRFEQVFKSRTEEINLQERAHTHMARQAQASLKQQDKYHSEAKARYSNMEQHSHLMEKVAAQELRSVVTDLLAGLERASSLAETIRTCRVKRSRCEHADDAIDLLMTEAKNSQKRRLKCHELVARYRQGAELLNMWAEWLRGSYRWMEVNMLAKREALKQELPAEKLQFEALLHEFSEDSHHSTRRQSGRGRKRSCRNKTLSRRRSARSGSPARRTRPTKPTPEYGSSSRASERSRRG